MLKLVFFLSVFGGVLSNELPKVSLSAQKLSQKAGQKVYIPCGLLEGSLPVKFEWLKNGKLIQPSKNVDIDTSKRSSALILDFPSMMDAGNYTCRASNSFGSDQATTHLTVEGSPQWLVKPSDIRISPKEGFSIQCSGIGHPPPSVTWKKQINEEWQDLFESTNSFHRITPSEINGQQLIKERDEGKYGCEISNGINPSLWSEFMIKVSETIQFEREIRNLSQKQCM